ncbi:MAG: hypothetical protein KKH98_03520 [Spirochaetes bacterium]|nr:hypothetical protein [Spirochaetota bacterium]
MTSTKKKKGTTEEKARIAGEKIGKMIKQGIDGSKEIWEKIKKDGPGSIQEFFNGLKDGLK